MIQYTESGPTYNGRTFRTVHDASLAEWLDQFGVNWGYEEACFQRMQSKYPRRITTSFILPEIRSLIFTSNYNSPMLELDFMLSLPESSWDSEWQHVYTAAPNVGVQLHAGFQQLETTHGIDVEKEIIPNLPATPYMHYCYRQKDSPQDPYGPNLPILAIRDRVSDYGREILQMPVSDGWRTMLNAISKGEQMAIGIPTERTHAWTTELALRTNLEITAQTLQHMAQTRICPGCNRMQFTPNHPGMLRVKCKFCHSHLFMLGKDSSRYFGTQHGAALTQDDLMELLDTLMVVMQYLEDNGDTFTSTARQETGIDIEQAGLNHQAMFFADILEKQVANHMFNGLSVLRLASALYLTQGLGEGWLPGNPSPGALDELSQRNSMASPLCPSTATVAQRRECNEQWAMLPAIVDTWMSGQKLDHGALTQIRQALRLIIANLQRDGLAHWLQFGMNGLSLTPD